MVAKRSLPERRNPLIEPTSSPPFQDLVNRRRLGQTNLAVKPGAVGVSNATKGENLGTFDYAHLRVPLPKDLSGSGIFTLKTTSAYPESYFLMRRSSDGFISATGMFKAAFPWASLSEEETERKFQKTFPSAGPEEVAGSVWVAPEEALQLSEEYGMRAWIEALLDSSDIEKGTKDKHNTHIQMPPKFDPTKVTPPVVLPPTSALRSTRARSTRSASPSKMATPSCKIASPRKRTTRKAAKAETPEVEEAIEATKTTFSASTLQNVIENGTVASESIAFESVNGEVKELETVRIEVQETVEQVGDVETTTTNVKIDVPADHPELREPEDPTKMIEEAKRMVELANREAEAGASNAGAEIVPKSTKSKRKAEEITRGDEDAEESEGRPAKHVKTAYTPEQKYTKEKVTRRALVGLTVMAAIGTAFQYFGA